MQIDEVHKPVQKKGSTKKGKKKVYIEATTDVNKDGSSPTKEVENELDEEEVQNALANIFCELPNANYEVC